MDFVASIDKWLTRILELVLVVLFAFFLVMVCLLVILRYGFAESILGGNEGVTIAFLFTSAIGGAVGISRREHIAITYFIDQLPHKAKLVAYLSGLVLIGVINAAMVYYSITWIQQAGHMPWEPLGWAQGWVQAAIPIGCSLAVFYCLIKIVLTLGGREQIDVLWLPED